MLESVRNVIHSVGGYLLYSNVVLESVNSTVAIAIDPSIVVLAFLAYPKMLPRYLLVNMRQRFHGKLKGKFNLVLKHRPQDAP
jgi:hypothetical protein